MPLRKCGSCGGSLPAGATARARFCSATCRKRANRAGGSPTPLALVTTPEDTETDLPPMTHLEALESAAARLVTLLGEADPRSAAALNKEYRDTLRELESLRDVSQSEGGRGRSEGQRRPFNAAAI